MNTCEATINHCQGRTVTGRARLRIASLLAILAAWHTRRAQRRELLGMPDYLLKDMGITRADLERESRKPFWRA